MKPLLTIGVRLLEPYRAKRSCGMQGAVCPVIMIERFEFAQGVQKVD
jgi:hypothetical protein